jgi:hypothetical protein
VVLVVVAFRPPHYMAGRDGPPYFATLALSGGSLNMS